MGVILDTSVLMAAEKQRLDITALFAAHEEEIFCIAAITAAELLHGVERAKPVARKQSRSRFVEWILAQVETIDFDLLVVDVMMPVEDGLSLTQWLRGRSGQMGATPVLILTARDLPEDRIAGLRLGADDYLAKPFDPEELVLRIEAILRRVIIPGSARIIALGLCSFDVNRGELNGADGPVRLTEAESRLLRQLALAAPSPVDRLALIGDGADASGRAVDIQVTRLRRKIEPDPANPRYLRTVRGIGYALTPD